LKITFVCCKDCFCLAPLYVKVLRPVGDGEGIFWWWWCYPTLPKDGSAEELTEVQQSVHAPRAGSEVKNGSSAKGSAPERLRFTKLTRRPKR